MSYQFSIRSLFVVTMIVAIISACMLAGNEYALLAMALLAVLVDFVWYRNFRKADRRGEQQLSECLIAAHIGAAIGWIACFVGAFAYSRVLIEVKWFIAGGALCGALIGRWRSAKWKRPDSKEQRG